jgi:superoxide reductase
MVVETIPEYKELYQSADWKTEKHVPVIEVSEKIKKGEACCFTVTVGKEIPHPNTTEHHIRWIEIYFKPIYEKFAYQIGRFEFNSHGESVDGADSSTIYSSPEVSLVFKTEKSGTIFASSYCNIHGLWQSAKEIEVR